MAINLLPWRQEKREQAKKRFIIFLSFGLGIALVVLGFIQHRTTNLINNQLVRNQILEKEITKLNLNLQEIKSIKQLETEQIARMLILQNVQSARVLIVHLFDELTKIMPAEVYLTKLQREQEIISLWGLAKSNADISELMKNMDQNAWIKNPILTEIKQGHKRDGANEFKLNFILVQKVGKSL